MKTKLDYFKDKKKDFKQSVIELQLLLSDYHMYYQKLRNFHWNVKGKHFFDLHDRFEEMYGDARVKIDEIAERILTLRAQPYSNYSDYLRHSSLEEANSGMSSTEMVTEVLMDHTILIDRMRRVASSASEVDDEGTVDLIGAYIRELEKSSWMLDAWLQDSRDSASK